jgi:hypothetical protein
VTSSFKKDGWTADFAFSFYKIIDIWTVNSLSLYSSLNFFYNGEIKNIPLSFLLREN